MFSRNRFGFAVTLLMGACLSNLAHSTFAANPVACNLMTQTDVEAVLHGKYTAASDPHHPLTCQYLPQAVADVPTLAMVVKSSVDFDTFVRALGSAATPVPGIGEKAILLRPVDLYVYSKGYMLQFTLFAVNSRPADQNAAVLKELAKRAVQRF